MDEIVIPVRTLGALNLPGYCPRCYWITLRCNGKFPFQIPMPGIFNSIDGYSKAVIHSYFDANNVLPPWFPDVGPVSGYTPSRLLHWSLFRISDAASKIVLRGTPDDVFRLSDGSYHIVDYKTAKATETQDGLYPLYEVQLNVYAWIAQEQGLAPVVGLSLIYMEPETVVDGEMLKTVTGEDRYFLSFRATMKNVNLNPGGMVPGLLKRAREIYYMETAPAGNESCENCELVSRLFGTLV